MTSPAEPQPPVPRVQIQLPAALEPVYANFAILTHSSSEIVIDHAQLLPQVPQARVVARVIMTPQNAKLLLRALNEHLGRFESQFGTIPIPEDSTLANHLFRPLPPETPPSE